MSILKVGQLVLVRHRHDVPKFFENNGNSIGIVVDVSIEPYGPYETYNNDRLFYLVLINETKKLYQASSLEVIYSQFVVDVVNSMNEGK